MLTSFNFYATFDGFFLYIPITRSLQLEYLLFTFRHVQMTLKHSIPLYLLNFSTLEALNSARYKVKSGLSFHVSAIITNEWQLRKLNSSCLWYISQHLVENRAHLKRSRWAITGNILLNKGGISTGETQWLPTCLLK